ncbi:MAG: hypothetical protein H6672_01165 [Anaerolineaceae bacterium]|nr:hypothetical protein [Anaerolineaceae bacterium]
MTDRLSYPCPYCQIGYCHPEEATYTRLHHGRVVSVPDMLAWTCDICFIQEFDQDAVRQVETLLGINQWPTLPARPVARANTLDLPNTKNMPGLKP